VNLTRLFSLTLAIDCPQPDGSGNWRIYVYPDPDTEHKLLLDDASKALLQEKLAAIQQIINQTVPLSGTVEETRQKQTVFKDTCPVEEWVSV
jgi:hypothetical protein